MKFPTIMENKIHVPNHQPVMDSFILEARVKLLTLTPSSFCITIQRISFYHGEIETKSWSQLA
jgi:hypothetical protein